MRRALALNANLSQSEQTSCNGKNINTHTQRRSIAASDIRDDSETTANDYANALETKEGLGTAPLHTKGQEETKTRQQMYRCEGKPDARISKRSI
eukprot:6208514-Pleurochrysis_carterae.AAC.2